MDFQSALQEFGNLKNEAGRHRYQVGLQDSVIDSLVQRLGALLNHFYTSNLIINSFGSDLIPIKFNTSRVSNYVRLDRLEKLTDSILNDIKLKEKEESSRPKVSSESESLLSAYKDLMAERNDIVGKHNELVTELEDLYPKLEAIGNQKDNLEQSVKKLRKWLAIVSALLLTTLNFSIFAITEWLKIWLLVTIQLFIIVIFLILKTGKLPIFKNQPIREFGMKFLNDFLVKFTVALALLGLGYLVYFFFGVKIKF